jgi:hypothetical protein
MMVNFEIGELNPYVEHVRGDALRDGEIYFRVTYLDDLLLVPQLEPYVFIGRDLDERDEQQVYFQDASSYAAGVRFESALRGSVDIGEAHIISGSTSDVRVMTFDEALRALMKCELRRREAASLIGKG